MAFEEFHKSKYVSSKGNFITITKTGVMNVSTEAYQGFLKGVEHVLFLFDREKNLIGIKPMKEKNLNSYNVRVMERGKAAAKAISISAVAFLKHYNIDYREKRKLEPKWQDEKHELIVLDLNKPL